MTTENGGAGAGEGGGAGAGAGEGGGNTPPVVKVEDARAYLSNYVSDPKGLETMAEKDLLGFHTRVKTFNEKSIAEAVTAAQAKGGGTFPTNWREQLAGDDKAALQRLARFNAPGDLFKSFAELDGKLAKGELRAPLAKDATTEQIADYRKANGIPEKSEGYKLDLPDGLVVGEADKPMVGKFLETMHKANSSQEAVTSALSAYYQLQNEAIAAREDADLDAETKAEETLKKEWEADYKRNMNLVKSLTDTMPPEVSGTIWKSRGPDGKPLNSNPKVIAWMATMARAVNPAATVTTAVGAEALKDIESELSGLQKMMGDRSSAYWQGPESKKNQERYRELLDAKTGLGRQAA